MWDPFAEMEDTFNRLPAVNSALKAFTPAVDVYETDKAVVVETPLAGFNPADVKVSVENGVLTLQGEHKKEHEIEEKNYYRKEVRSGAFYRQIALPTAVQEDQVEASFEDGILKISCPKTKPAEPKKVEIKITKK
ncbi:MAG: hypothetical protein A2537_01905 [Candidatus Magasanikbacteria bacterium RIFOXYD2_FULL_36_9]|jgi:HSP20 family protein|uniref:SHSP domain-containing protein n=1 Tax=Candidatus Magasanikbacteria bacterium RIFOXYD2_FULL_36_9 TaxID=1798707 RepID=A0A1F6NYD8_9BACT|nr:MAG: hypothetical protein A2537_01905 [Candidatus Magasanikbacteria bacterium RIFOXYD2_FULL_36_9]